MQRHPSIDPLEGRHETFDVRALVVGSDPLAREHFVDRLEGVWSVQSGDSRELGSRSRSEHADVIVWDLGPGPAALDAELMRDVDVPIVVLVSDETPARPWLAAGAAAVLGRDVESGALRHAVETVRHGLTVIDPRLVDLSANDPAEARETIQPRAFDLTPREHQVLEELATGSSNKEIAKALEISTHTVKFHTAAILDKLGADTRTEAVVMGLRSGLLSL